MEAAAHVYNLLTLNEVLCKKTKKKNKLLSMNWEGLIAIVLGQDALFVYLLHGQCRTEKNDYVSSLIGYNILDTIEKRPK